MKIGGATIYYSFTSESHHISSMIFRLILKTHLKSFHFFFHATEKKYNKITLSPSYFPLNRTNPPIKDIFLLPRRIWFCSLPLYIFFVCFIIDACFMLQNGKTIENDLFYPSDFRFVTVTSTQFFALSIFFCSQFPCEQFLPIL